MRKLILLLAILTAFCKRQPNSNEQVIPVTVKKTYFIVTTREGLNLRAAPNTSAKILTVLPFKYRGEIIEKGNQGEYIQNAIGYWAKVNYRGQEGWVFSGFIWLLSSPDEKIQLPESDMYEMNVGDSLTELPLEKAALPNLRMFKKVRNQWLGDQEFELFLAKQVSEMECDGVDLVILAKGSKATYQTKVIREFFKPRTPESAKFLSFEDVYGYCGCGGHLVLRTIYNTTEGLKTFSMDAPNQLKVGDFCPLFDGHTPAKNSVRWEPGTNRLFVHSLTTNCRPRQDFMDSKISKFHSGYFKVYDFSGPVLKVLAQIDGDDIPAAYQQFWNASPLM